MTEEQQIEKRTSDILKAVGFGFMCGVVFAWLMNDGENENIN